MGIQEFVFKFLTKLIMKRNKVFIFNRRTIASIYGIGTYIYELIDCLKDLNIEFEVVQLHSEETEVSIIQKDGYRQISIPTIFFKNSKDADRYSRNIAYILSDLITKDKNINYIFHLNYINDENIAFYLRKLLKGKIVLTLHYSNWGFNLSGNYTRLMDILSKKKSKVKDKLDKETIKDIAKIGKIIKYCHYVVFISEYSMRISKQIYKIKDDKITVINYGQKDVYHQISYSERNRIRKKYFLSEDETILIFVGRLEEIKGVFSLIKALKKVLNSYVNVRLLIIGDGDFTKCLSESENIWAKITFTGFLTKEQLYEFFKIGDIGIVSSIYEEFGLVVTEMMMHKLPVIVANTSGPAEIIEDNYSGLKVPILIEENKPVLDIDILANRILRLIENPSYAAKIANNGRYEFLKKYELSIFKNKIINLYQKL